jgi:hypothetical protein
MTCKLMPCAHSSILLVHSALRTDCEGVHQHAGLLQHCTISHAHDMPCSHAVVFIEE